MEDPIVVATSNYMYKIEVIEPFCSIHVKSLHLSHLEFESLIFSAEGEITSIKLDILKELGRIHFENKLFNIDLTHMLNQHNNLILTNLLKYANFNIKMLNYKKIQPLFLLKYEKTENFIDAPLILETEMYYFNSSVLMGNSYVYDFNHLQNFAFNPVLFIIFILDTTQKENYITIDDEKYVLWKEEDAIQEVPFNFPDEILTLIYKFDGKRENKLHIDWNKKMSFVSSNVRFYMVLNTVMRYLHGSGSSWTIYK